MSDGKVKAAVLSEFGKLEIMEFPDPEVQEDSMVARMVMVGICGTDKHVFDGKAPDLTLPLILGHENLAIVEKIGRKAREALEVNGQILREGDRITWWPGILCGECWYCRWIPAHPSVFCVNGWAYGFRSCKEPPHLYGGYAEKVYIEPGTKVWKIPDDMPDEVAVLQDIFAAVNGVLRALTPYTGPREGFRPTDTVAVQGAGAMGLAAAVTAWLCGAYQIILVGGPAHRLQLARELGIFDHIISIEEVRSAADRVSLVKELTPGGAGPDLVVECTGVPAAVPEGLEMVRRGGTFVEIGSFVDTGETTISPFKHLCYKDVRLIGQYGGNNDYIGIALKFLEMALRRGVPVGRLVTHRVPLLEAQRAMELAEHLEGLKIVLTM
jgi:threonine dehydrogenase-like Zn-dependent dehydrogenase